MKAIILAIGHELTNGLSIDTNSAWLSIQLGRLGIETIEHRTLPDDQSAIAAAITDAARRAELVIATGGLGPTPDDLTRQALAEAMGVDLDMDEASLADIEEFFRHRGREMKPINRVQAMTPRGAIALRNSCGTAPGLRAKWHRATVFVTPGVPSEMRAMFQDQILPHLPQTGRVILQEIVHCFGTGESDLAERIQDLLTRDGPVVAGTTVAAGLISIRISSVAKTLEHARVQADERIKAIRTRLGDLVLGVGEEATMEAVVGELLRRRGQTLATAESCTGGLLGERLTTVSGSSAYYLGGVVSYANRIKQEQLGVPPDMLAAHGAVSEPVAQAMAEGVRRMMDADWGIGITGVAGPTGGSEDKPVGTVFTSLAGPGGVRVQHHRFPGDRAMVRLRSVLAALDALRRELQAVSP